MTGDAEYVESAVDCSALVSEIRSLLDPALVMYCKVQQTIYRSCIIRLKS